MSKYSLFQGIFDTDMTSVISISDFFIMRGMCPCDWPDFNRYLYVWEPNIPKALWQPWPCFRQ